MLSRQYASITPQAISVWCRQLGHETFYATYYGLGRPERRLPSDLDVVFIACYTQVSAIAYVLAKRYRRAGTRTVIGGAHAKAFPSDCLRFFDLVVQECDKALVADILAGHYAPGSIISSARPFDDVPPVEERIGEIRAASFIFGRQFFFTVVPLLTSVGCPYTCDFCVDWKNPYRLLSTDRLAADIRYLAGHGARSLVAFHDPNFAVKFDQVLEILETLPAPSRLPYLMESSLSNLRGARMDRLRETRCLALVSGIESWADYSNKAGVGRKAGIRKVDDVVEHCTILRSRVPYVEANFMFGLDSDGGDEPVELTKAFMDRTPFVWPTLSIPIPYGGTPMYDRLMADDRVLRAMPFCFYYAPYVSITLKNYDIVEYYEKLLELFTYRSSPEMFKRRMNAAESWKFKVVHWARRGEIEADIQDYRQILARLKIDRELRAFHQGESDELPAFYVEEYKRILGSYREVLTPEDLRPCLAVPTGSLTRPRFG